MLKKILQAIPVRRKQSSADAIPFYVTDPNDGKTYQLSSEVPAESSTWDKALGSTRMRTGAAAFALSLASYFMLAPDPSAAVANGVVESSFRTPTPLPAYTTIIPTNLREDKTDSVTSIILNDDTLEINQKDRFIRSIIAQTNYVDYVNLAVDNDALWTSYHALEQLSFDELMQTGNYGPFSAASKYTANGTFNFDSAMVQLYAHKKDGLLLPKYHELADELVAEYIATGDESKSSLLDYSSFLENELFTFKDEFKFNKFLNHYDGKGDTKKEMRRALSNMYADFNGAMLLAYQTTEIFNEVNPVFNAVFLDNLLATAGTDFIKIIPSNGDELLSYGPFQLTSSVVAGKYSAIGLNKFLPRKEKVPESLEEYTHLDDQVKLSSMNMLYNTQVLANGLRRNNTLTKFNNFYESLTEQEQSALTTGVLGMMHHSPRAGLQGVNTYLNTHNNPSYSNFMSEVDFGKSKNHYFEKTMKNYLAYADLLPPLHEANK